MIDDIVAAMDQVILSDLGVAAITTTTYYEEVDTEFQSCDLRLSRWPVQSVVAVSDAGSLIAPANYVTKQEGYLRLRSDVSWSVGVAAVSVTYVHGLPDDQLLDIQRAATEWAAAMVNTSPHQGFKSEKIGGYNYTLQDSLASGSAPASVTRALNRLRQVFFE